MADANAAEIFTKRQFSDQDQREFVRMTGDANPIHADHAAAAGMFTRGIIVHGVHGLMWAVDAYLKQHPGLSVRSFQATFLKPIRLNEVVVASAQRTPEGVKLKLSTDGLEMTAAKIVFGEAPRPGDAALTAAPYPPPPKRALNELVGVSGTLVMPSGAADLARSFPTLADAVGPTVLVGLGSLATLVGMECPGLYGVSTDIAVDVSTETGALTYAVRRVDKRFARAEIAVEGYGVSGTVGAFVNEPKAQLA